MMQNENGKCMVEHHTHYKEIHGYDKTVWLTVSDHRKLHVRLRNEGKCNIPSPELHKTVKLAYLRTDKGKQYSKNYVREYSNKYLHRFNFSDNLGNGIRHREEIIYNTNTDIIQISGRFEGHPGVKLIEVDLT